GGSGPFRCFVSGAVEAVLEWPVGAVGTDEQGGTAGVAEHQAGRVLDGAPGVIAGTVEAPPGHRRAVLRRDPPLLVTTAELPAGHGQQVLHRRAARTPGPIRRLRPAG